MSDRSTIMPLGAITRLPLAMAPMAAVPSPANAPARDEIRWSKQTQRQLQGALGSASLSAGIQAIQETDRQASLLTEKGTATASLGSAAQLHASARHAGSLAKSDGTVLVDGAAVAQTTAKGEILTSPTLTMAKGQLLAEAAARLRGAIGGRIDTRSGISASGAIAGEGELVAHASAQGSLIATPRLLTAQAQLLSEAVARFAVLGTGQVALGRDVVLGARASAAGETATRALAQGSMTVSPTTIDAQGTLLTEAVARTQTDVSGHVELTPALQADAGETNTAMVGTRAASSGDFHVGVDSDGIPSFHFGAMSEATVGASAKTLAHGQVSLLGLLTVGASGSAEALAGLAAGASGEVALENRTFSIASGARGAMGFGAGATGSISVGLGTLPSGFLKTVVGPIVALPTLLISSAVHEVSHWLGATDPLKKAPGITDYPHALVANVKGGIQMMGQGAKETVDDVGDVGTAIGRGVEALAHGIADAGETAYDDLKKGL